MTTISGGIFNFTEGGYSAPTWSGINTYNFTGALCLYQIYSDDTFIFAATNKGLRVYNLENDKLCAYIEYTKGFNTVAGNNTEIYLGTSGQGVKTLPTTCVSGNEDNPYDLSTCLADLVIDRITSKYINYLHISDNTVGICTNSGVDFLMRHRNPEIHSQTFINDAKKCFVSNRSIYYTTTTTDTTNSGIKYHLNAVDVCLTDWVTPDRVYTTGSGIFEENIELSDFYITTGTAENNRNTIFCATTSGVYIIDEDTEQYAIFYTRN